MRAPFKIGTRVRIRNKLSIYNGRSGKILKRGGDNVYTVYIKDSLFVNGAIFRRKELLPIE